MCVCVCVCVHVRVCARARVCETNLLNVQCMCACVRVCLRTGVCVCACLCATMQRCMYIISGAKYMYVCVLAQAREYHRTQDL